MHNVGRNDPCPCGSGKRAKHCCYRLVADEVQAGGVAASAPGASTLAHATTDAQAHFNEAARCLAQGAPAAAVMHLEHALAVRPDNAEAHLLLAQALRQQGKIEAAAARLEQGLLLMPHLAEAHSNLGLLYGELGKRDAAIASFRTALSLKPDLAWAHCNLGNLLVAMGKLPEAVESYRKALAIEPDHVEAWINLGNTLNAQDDVDAALECYREALSIKPDNAVAHMCICAPLQAQGNVDAAIDSLRTALSLDPGYAEAHSALLFLLSFHPGYTHEERLAAARRYGASVMARAKPFERWRAHTTAALPLRVGLVSGDLRTHPVGFFVESILGNVDPARIELIAYPTSSQEDATSARLKPRFAAWNSIAGLSDEDAATRIHGDGIHILIDLAGHTAHNRLPVFAWRPAPVQVSWLGYFATTGVPTIDYLLADRMSVPDSLRAQFTETIWHLPDTRFCFTPPGDATRLQPAPLPFGNNGYITFGCFQNPLKLNDSVLAAWGRILSARPDARLRLLNRQMGFPAAKTRLNERLRHFGIAPDRVTMVGMVPRDEFLMAHADVDMILDTFPYPGGTTTCEALWMGVPTVTLAGDTMVSRQGASLLACAGLDDWIAFDEDGYVALALAHADDVNRLAMLRAALRARALASPLFDAPRFAGHLAAALEGMWAQRNPQ